MCTAAAYKTKDFYFGRTLDYEFSFGDQVTITPRNYPFRFRFQGTMETHYAMIGMAHVADDYLLWSSIFVTLVAKKYHESVTLPSGLRMVYDNH